MSRERSRRWRAAEPGRNARLCRAYYERYVRRPRSMRQRYLGDWIAAPGTGLYAVRWG